MPSNPSLRHSLSAAIYFFCLSSDDVDGRTVRIAKACFCGPKAGICKSEVQLERASRPVSEVTR